MVSTFTEINFPIKILEKKKIRKICIKFIEHNTENQNITQKIIQKNERIVIKNFAGKINTKVVWWKIYLYRIPKKIVYKIFWILINDLGLKIII